MPFIMIKKTKGFLNWRKYFEALRCSPRCKVGVFQAQQMQAMPAECPDFAQGFAGAAQGAPWDKALVTCCDRSLLIYHSLKAWVELMIFSNPKGRTSKSSY